MSLRDKILKLFQEQGPLSTEEVRKLLKEKYKIERNKRTIQHHVQKLIDDGKLDFDKPLGREQTYSLKSSTQEEKDKVTGYLLKRFWREEEKIENEAVHGDPLDALLKAELLWKKLPSPFKEKLAPTFDTASKEFVRYYKSLKYPFQLGTFEEKKAKLHGYVRGKIIPNLVECVCAALNELEGSLKRNEH
jgi:hypothetical protein